PLPGAGREAPGRGRAVGADPARDETDARPAPGLPRRAKRSEDLPRRAPREDGPRVGAVAGDRRQGLAVGAAKSRGLGAAPLRGAALENRRGLVVDVSTSA